VQSTKGLSHGCRRDQRLAVVSPTSWTLESGNTCSERAPSAPCLPLAFKRRSTGRKKITETNQRSTLSSKSVTIRELKPNIHSISHLPIVTDILLVVNKAERNRDIHRSIAVV
jgi:hypothetical protein